MGFVFGSDGIGIFIEVVAVRYDEDNNNTNCEYSDRN